MGPGRGSGRGPHRGRPRSLDPGERADAPTDLRVPGWLPDAITLARIALLPLLLTGAEAVRQAAASGTDHERMRALVIALFVAMAASDKLDGFLARRSGRPTTRRGALLDAGADRLVQWAGTSWLALRAAPAFTPLPLWLPAVLVLRDATLFGVWLGRSRSRDVPVEHERHGKTATLAVSGLILVALLAAPARMVEAASALVALLAIRSTARYAIRTGTHDRDCEETHA